MLKRILTFFRGKKEEGGANAILILDLTNVFLAAVKPKISAPEEAMPRLLAKVVVALIKAIYKRDRLFIDAIFPVFKDDVKFDRFSASEFADLLVKELRRELKKNRIKSYVFRSPVIRGGKNADDYFVVGLVESLLSEKGAREKFDYEIKRAKEPYASLLKETLARLLKGREILAVVTNDETLKSLVSKKERTRVYSVGEVRCQKNRPCYAELS